MKILQNSFNQYGHDDGYDHANDHDRVLSQHTTTQLSQKEKPLRKCMNLI